MSGIVAMVSRPVVFSIDDCTDYQADFVLATLLDGTSPTQLSNSATASDIHSSSTVQQRVRAHKRTHDGHHNGSTSHSADIDQDDHSLLEDNVTPEPSRPADPTSQTNALTGTEARSKVSYKPAQDVTSTDFPSGSEFNTARRRNPVLSVPSSSKSPSAAHIPPPPTDTDYMDIEPSLPRTSVLGHPSGSNKDRSLRITAATRTEELMDALFGAENTTDVAEEGSAFGFSQKERDELNNSKSKTHSNQRKDAQSNKETVISGVAALPDRGHDIFPDDFPFEGTILLL